jgi:hypothetical protein
MAIPDTDLVHPRRCVEPAREDLDADDESRTS